MRNVDEWDAFCFEYNGPNELESVCVCMRVRVRVRVRVCVYSRHSLMRFWYV